MLFRLTRLSSFLSASLLAIGAARRRRWARADLAAQVDHLFTTTDPGDAHTIAALANGLGEGCRVTK
jgi:hypothetical protein